MPHQRSLGSEALAAEAGACQYPFHMLEGFIIVYLACNAHLSLLYHPSGQPSATTRMQLRNTLRLYIYRLVAGAAAQCRCSAMPDTSNAAVHGRDMGHPA